MVKTDQNNKKVSSSSSTGEASGEKKVYGETILIKKNGNAFKRGLDGVISQVTGYSVPVKEKKELPSLPRGNCSLEVYTDGGWASDKNIGSWSYLIRVRAVRYLKLNEPPKLSKFNLDFDSGAFYSPKIDIETMELFAVAKAFERLKDLKLKEDPSIELITIFCDNYCVANFYERIEQIRNNDWCFNNGRYIPEHLIAIYKYLDSMTKKYTVKFEKVKGHAAKLVQQGVLSKNFIVSHHNKRNDYVDRFSTLAKNGLIALLQDDISLVNTDSPRALLKKK